MKIHKRIPSGIENSSLLQNTQRIQAPKKLMVSSVGMANTARKQSGKIMNMSVHLQQNVDSSFHQKSFTAILQQTGVYDLYESFINFHLMAEQFYEANLISKLTNCCHQFQQHVKQLLSQQLDFNNISVTEQESADKIKQLLQQIYNLREKISRLEGSIQADSISSLDEIIKCTGLRVQTERQQKSPNNRSVSGCFTKNNKILDEASCEKQQGQDQKMSQLMNSCMEMKLKIFQFIWLIWRVTRLNLPNQASFLMSSITMFFRSQLQAYMGQNRQNINLSSSLNSIQSLLLICVNCVENLQRYEIDNSA